MRKLPIIFTVSVILACQCFSQALGKVVDVHDGDTLTLLDANKRQIKVRMAGIDAPELGQDFGQKAKRQLSDLVFGKTVTLEGNKIDRYGRRVAKVIANGRDANLEMVIGGLAWWYREYQREQSARDREIYAAAETDARSRKLGLWSIASPQPPWEFRHPAQSAPAATNGPIIGNRNSKIYHWPGCDGYAKVSERNRVPFKSKAEAESAGYRAARNCK